MKFEIEVDDQEIRKMVCQKLADSVIHELTSVDYSLPYDEREKSVKAKKKELLNKIDWKNAASLLSETVVQKFFSNLLDKQ